MSRLRVLDHISILVDALACVIIQLLTWILLRYGKTAFFFLFGFLYDFFLRSFLFFWRVFLPVFNAGKEVLNPDVRADAYEVKLLTDGLRQCCLT